MEYRYTTSFLTIRTHVAALFAVAIWLGNASCSRHFVPRGQALYTTLQIDSTIIDNPDYVRLYEPYKKQLEIEMDRVVGHAAIDLTKSGEDPETRLGNFFADALLAEARKRIPDADFSFGTKGGLRTELPRGPITIGRLFELMPFENEIVVLEISGKDVQALARFIAADGGQPVSGIRMEIDQGNATDIRIDGNPIDTSRNYKLVTYDYLANGGDHVRGLGRPLNRIDLGIKVREALIDYISEAARKGDRINTQLDGRIVRHR